MSGQARLKILEMQFQKVSEIKSLKGSLVMILKRMETDADQEGEPLSLPGFLKPSI